MSEFKAKRWLFTGVMLWRLEADPVFLHPRMWPPYVWDCCEPKVYQ